MLAERWYLRKRWTLWDLNKGTPGEKLDLRRKRRKPQRFRR